MNTDMNSILDSTLDDLADFPAFAVYPNGVHRVTFDFEEKVINKKPALELKFKLLETLELSDPADAAPEVGTESNCLLIFVNNDGQRNEFSEGTLKMVLTALKQNFPGNNNREVLNAAKGAEVAIVTKLKDNKDKTAKNMQLVSLAVL
jgi:hypothetical protein